jgi:hypothetical protein
MEENSFQKRGSQKRDSEQRGVVKQSKRIKEDTSTFASFSSPTSDISHSSSPTRNNQSLVQSNSHSKTSSSPSLSTSSEELPVTVRSDTWLYLGMSRKQVIKKIKNLNKELFKKNDLLSTTRASINQWQEDMRIANPKFSVDFILSQIGEIKIVSEKLEVEIQECKNELKVLGDVLNNSNTFLSSNISAINEPMTQPISGITDVPGIFSILSYLILFYFILI